MKAKDCIGRYGSLTVIENGELLIESSGRKRRTSKCICDCGTIVTIRNHCLINGATKSCGCLRSESMTKVATKHGLSKQFPREYRAWSALRTRCNNHERYKDRGISVHERWNEFSAFLEDMGPCPEGLSIDRINNDGHYEPGNCRWTNSLVQNNNRAPRRWYKRPDNRDQKKA